ncbi:DUF4142 domain-containing protein [Sphingomonas bacterium]|uniref:DUF4142 domain-containing protein n=1 Tax=Sphingomonas bacterium TaxID=1895847 RepID=UPI001575573F|nr:DUF4142 domain-containing protein [Sphingomonas bacterium]
MLSRFTLAACLFAAPAMAQLSPPPAPPEANTQAQPFLMAAGESDVYEITSSQIALTRSQNPAVKRYATELIGHHTMTTNNALKAAKAGGVTPPPPVLDASFRALISELQNAAPGDFDKLYIGQQIPAHQGALALQTAYSQGGDVASLRAAAKSALPYVKQHLVEAQTMQKKMMAM